ncbi:MAG: hypothetical protein ACLQBD_29115 [Syntrophobacteraceae bacterium]|jgi:hypothetical protein
MTDHSPHLQIIGQLAQEYDQKYRELEKLISEIPQENILPQIMALAERTTDRFRSAQMALISIPELFAGEEGEMALKAMTALCRAFDEMRILFHFLFENSHQGPDQV